MAAEEALRRLKVDPEELALYPPISELFKQSRGGLKTVMRAMDDLHNQFEAERGANMGKMPVVDIPECTTVRVQTPQGELRFKAPAWKIVSWIDAPDVFTAKKEVAAEVPAAEEDDLF